MSELAGHLVGGQVLRNEVLDLRRPERLSGDAVYFGMTLWAGMPLSWPPPSLPTPAVAWPKPWQRSAGREGLWCSDTGPGPVSRLLNAARSYRENWKNTGRPPHPQALAGPGGRISAARACCLGGAGAWGGGSGGGGRARAAACLSAGAGAGSCVSGSLLPPPPAPPPARPPARRASRPPAAAAARSPRGLAGCRLHRRGFAPFSRPLRLPELIWELFISCQKAAGPAKQTTLAAGPPGLARRGRPGPLPPGPRAPAASLEPPGRPGGRAAGGLGRPSGCT